MRIIGILIIGLTILSCSQGNSKVKTKDAQSDHLQIKEKPSDKEEIQNLIRQALTWADSKNSIGLLPVETDSSDSIYIGFDMKMHENNLDKLRATGFFAKEFIDNYDNIIKTIDKKLRNKEFLYENWLVGDLPIFKFANGANPWCMCQDNLDWETVEVEIVNLNETSGEIKWKWGNLKDYHSSWKDFSYDFKVVKENEKWKISYLHGFDYAEGIKSDGEL